MQKEKVLLYIFIFIKVMSVSQAAGNMAVWIRAVTLTYDALLIVEPKRL